MESFKDWINNTYETNVRQYRMALGWITHTVRQYAEGNIFEKRHVDTAITLLKEVPVPSLPKYPGEASEADKEYFKAMLKPNYRQILNDEIRKVEGLLTGKGG